MNALRVWISQYYATDLKKNFFEKEKNSFYWYKLPLQRTGLLKKEDEWQELSLSSQSGDPATFFASLLGWKVLPWESVSGWMKQNPWRIPNFKVMQWIKIYMWIFPRKCNKSAPLKLPVASRMLWRWEKIKGVSNGLPLESCQISPGLLPGPCAGTQLPHRQGECWKKKTVICRCTFPCWKYSNIRIVRPEQLNRNYPIIIGLNFKFHIARIYMLNWLFYSVRMLLRLMKIITNIFGSERSLRSESHSASFSIIQQYSASSSIILESSWSHPGVIQHHSGR